MGNSLLSVLGNNILFHKLIYSTYTQNININIDGDDDNGDKGWPDHSHSFMLIFVFCAVANVTWRHHHCMKGAELWVSICESIVWLVIDNMIHNLSTDSHIFVSDLNAAAETEEERGTHDMCAVCSLSLYRHKRDDDQIMRMDSQILTHTSAPLIRWWWREFKFVTAKYKIYDMNEWPKSTCIIIINIFVCVW